MRKCKSICIRRICACLNWVNDHVRHDRSRWFIEGILERLFAVAYRGSSEEIEDGIEFALDGVHQRFLTPKQREIASRIVEFI